ncbi:MAG: amidohydrolase family protein [Alphaproteobacteria bacterium]
MDLLLTDATVVTCDDARTILSDAAVAIRGDRIAAVGPTAELVRASPSLARRSLRGKAILPGLINGHTHTALTILRGSVEDLGGDAVYGYMSPVSYAMSAEQRGVMSLLGCLEAIRSGCTTLVENWRFVPTFAEVMAGSGLRLWLAENCADAKLLEIRHGTYTYDRAFGEEFLGRANELISAMHGSHGGRAQCQVAAHATDNCSPWMLGELTALAAKHGLTRTIHLAQSMKEVEQVKRMSGGLTPAGYMDAHGWTGPDVTGAHWSFCTPEDVALLARRDVRMAHCPANSSRRGPHRAPVNLIRDAGVTIAFGTDNMTEDMFQAMKIGSIVHRGSYGGGVTPDPQAMLDAVTRDGAKALGQLDQIGTIEAGKKADLTVIDLDVPVMRPVLNLVSNIVHYAHPGLVRHVVVDGEWVMEDGIVRTIDEPALVAEAQVVADRVWSKMLAESPDIAPPRGWRGAAG